jgi:hypothetical protein
MSCELKVSAGGSKLPMAEAAATPAGAVAVACEALLQVGALVSGRVMGSGADRINGQACSYAMIKLDGHDALAKLPYDENDASAPKSIFQHLTGLKVISISDSPMKYLLGRAT